MFAAVTSSLLFVLSLVWVKGIQDRTCNLPDQQRKADDHPTYGIQDAGHLRSNASLNLHVLGSPLKLSMHPFLLLLSTERRDALTGEPCFAWSGQTSDLTNGHASDYSTRVLVVQGQCWNWLAGCQHFVTE